MFLEFSHFLGTGLCVLPWSPVVSRGLPWSPVVSVVSHFSPWSPAVSHGLPQSPMVPVGEGGSPRRRFALKGGSVPKSWMTPCVWKQWKLWKIPKIESNENSKNATNVLLRCSSKLKNYIFDMLQRYENAHFWDFPQNLVFVCFGMFRCLRGFRTIKKYQAS